MTRAGPAIPVVVSNQPPDGGPALRVAVVSDGRPTEAGPARAVVVVTDNRPTQGNEPVPVVASSGNGFTLAGPAIPVVVVSGSLGGNVPVNTVLPVVSGTTELGATLTTTDGTWTNSPTGYTYQWKRNGANIAAATANTYVLVGADLGTTITVTVTATNAGGPGLPATSAGTAIPLWLIDDHFTTNQGAPIGSPRAAEPGPGSWTVIDTGNKVSIAGNKLTFASTTTSNADPRLQDALRAVVPGRVLQATINTVTMPEIGWGTNAQTDGSQQGLVFFGNGLYVYDTTLQIGPVGAYTSNVDYVATLVQRYGGALICVQGGAQFPTAQLFWATNIDMTAATGILRAVLGTFLGVGPARFDDVTMLDYGGEWSKHYPYASVATQIPAALSTATMAADAVIEIVWKALAGETADIAVRYVDDSNRWAVRLVQSTATFSLVEVNAGVETVRATSVLASGGTIAANDWMRIFIRCSGSRIDIQTKSVTGSASNKLLTYSSATFQQTATGFKLMGGTVFYGLAIWPVAFAAPALAQLSSIAPVNILAIGDSRTGGAGDTTNVPGTSKNGYLYWMWTTIEAGRGAGAYERPLRIAHSGFTTAQLKAAIDADLAAAVGTPDVVVLNIGVNDLSALPVQATFQTNLAYILDAIHTKWVSIPIAMSLVWAIGQDANANTWASWAASVISARSFVVVGCDERITLKGSDNGASEMSDTVHPNTLGYQLLAASYKTALGL